MSSPDTAFSLGDLSITTSTSADGETTLAWLGTSDAREPGLELTPFLSSFADEHAGKAVVLDFRKLGYMNSATVSPIIHFARALDAQGVRTRILFDAGVGWQRVNFVAMKSIARTLTHITVEG